MCARHPSTAASAPSPLRTDGAFNGLYRAPACSTSARTGSTAASTARTGTWDAMMKPHGGKRTKVKVRRKKSKPQEQEEEEEEESETARTATAPSVASAAASPPDSSRSGGSSPALAERAVAERREWRLVVSAMARRQLAGANGARQDEGQPAGRLRGLREGEIEEEDNTQVNR